MGFHTLIPYVSSRRTYLKAQLDNGSQSEVYLIIQQPLNILFIEHFAGWLVGWLVGCLVGWLVLWSG